MMTTYTMTLGGWISLTLSLGFVVGLFVWCMVRVLRNSPKDGKKKKTGSMMGKRD